MTFSLTWLPEVLEGAGLRVSRQPGWETRGRGDVGDIVGVICHHTGTPGHKDKNMPTLNTLLNGRPDLAGPLAQLGLGRDGTYYVLAAGRANHAGRGIWQNHDTGNTNFIGIEAENSGLSVDFPWPQAQMEAYRRGVAAILKKIGKTADFCCGHKEYARPVGRKDDPTFDMNVFRAGVAAILNGTAARPVLRRLQPDPAVAEVQRKLNVQPANGLFGPETEQAVIVFQQGRGLSVDGVVGASTWTELDKLR